MSAAQTQPLLKEYVRKEWVDYNGHMNDAAYALVFSKAVDQLMIELGIDETFRKQYQYSIYTLETHLCYLAEAHLDELLTVTVQLLNSDAKRLHVFFTMENKGGKRLATSEQMLMGIDMESGRPAPFPPSISTHVQNLAKIDEKKEKPNEAGRNIQIPSPR
ncbi:thioesterase family protein [Priestia endophytica]|jgi:acyl-CoA thioester hydrolase|uniref:thioesterase family protein n=1 Tax=Priestia endophytica TaxID=135735 RepID=UPI000F543847|nr:thioesterase family protein [Priestia endophytica]MED4073021.1 thioesterase family protein [Priestia endophytica]RPK12548.1 3-hydroxyacyl-CoA dehydrogenase [Priestia endophytica]